jgi:RNA polymerase sigma factor (sigma-70 family)
MEQGTTAFLQLQIDRLKQGDESARDALIGRAGQRLQFLTRKIFSDFQRVRKYEDTGDVLQGAYMRLLRRLKAATPTTVQEFFQIAAREIRCTLIDLARHYYGPLGAGANEEAPALVQSDSSVVALEISDRRNEPSHLSGWTEFHQHIETLPEEERVVVDLLWYHGMTQEEAAHVLDISLSTLKRRWMTARVRLQSILPDLVA